MANCVPLPIFVNKKFTGTQPCFYLLIACDCFYTTMAELSGCARDHMSGKAEQK